MDLKENQKLFSTHATPFFSMRFARYLLLRNTGQRLCPGGPGAGGRHGSGGAAPPPTWAPRVKPGTACHVALLPRPPAPKRSRAEMTKPPSPSPCRPLLPLPPLPPPPPPPLLRDTGGYIRWRHVAPGHPTASRRGGDPCSGSLGPRVVVSSSAVSAVLSPPRFKSSFAFPIRPRQVLLIRRVLIAAAVQLPGPIFLIWSVGFSSTHSHVKISLLPFPCFCHTDRVGGGRGPRAAGNRVSCAAFVPTSPFPWSGVSPSCL
jgi:hypothetical protein